MQGGYIDIPIAVNWSCPRLLKEIDMHRGLIISGCRLLIIFFLRSYVLGEPVFYVTEKTQQFV